MQTQNGLNQNSSLSKFVLGAHPIIEHFIETLRIREIIGSYLPTDRRMKLDDGKTLALLIHNILTSPNPLYEMEDWLKPLDAEKVGLRPEETKWIQDDRIGRALAKFYNSRHKERLYQRYWGSGGFSRTRGVQRLSGLLARLASLLTLHVQCYP